MKTLGITICIVGTILAILFVPTQLLGTNTGWRFIFGAADAGFGLGKIRYYEFINGTMLMLELILINGIGLALFFIGRRQMVK